MAVRVRVRRGAQDGARAAAASSEGDGARKQNPLDARELELIDAYWRAANYLSVGQIYLLDNPLLREPLKPEHQAAAAGPLGHDTRAELHLGPRRSRRSRRAISTRSRRRPGAWRARRQWPTHISRAPGRSSTLGRLPCDEGMSGCSASSRSRAASAATSRPRCRGRSTRAASWATRSRTPLARSSTTRTWSCFCVVGDGEAETGPLAASWHSNKFLDPVRDGAVLPILHLNGYKIANPTFLARIPEKELIELFEGYGYSRIRRVRPRAGHDAPEDGRGDGRGARRHRAIQRHARDKNDATTADLADDRAPLAQGLDRPEGRRRQADRGHVALAPGAARRTCAATRAIAQLEAWLRSYRPDELFDADGRLRPELAALPPKGNRRMWANPHTNGGLLRDLSLPDFRDYAVTVAAGRGRSEATRVLGQFLRDVIERNPDTLPPVRTGRDRLEPAEPGVRGDGASVRGELLPTDEHQAPDGRVIEVLSEHLCEGWLEGYLLTGRHGLFNCYEAFIHIVDAMFNQHAKWLKQSTASPGAGRSRRSTTCCRATSGARTTTASATRTRASSTWS